MSELAGMEWLARTTDVQVRVMVLPPGGGTPWHFHRNVTDYVFGLDEGVEVALRAPSEVVTLRPGQRQDVPSGRVHRVVNPSADPARYLLVQATGTYDFNEVT